MATSYFGFSVSNTNGNKTQRSVVRVYDEQGNKIAEQFINKRDPLGYIRKYAGSKHKSALREQCLANGMDEDIFYSIFC